VFVGNPEPDPNSLWKIFFNKNDYDSYATFISLQHIKSNNFLCIGYKSPITEHTEGDKLKYFVFSL
jgi:hypothetical protein